MKQTKDNRVHELEALIEAARNQKKDKTAANLLNELSWELRKSDACRSLELAVECRTLSEKCNHPSGIAYSHRNEGYLRLMQSELQEALASSLESLKMFEELADPAGEASSLNILGNVYHALGDYENALRSHMKGLQINETINDRKGQAISLNNIGTVYQRLNDTARALEYYMKSLHLRDEIGDRSGEGGPLNNIGLVYQELGDHERALEFYFKGLTAEDTASASHAILLMNIGNSYFRLGDVAQAGDFLHRSKDISDQLGDREASAGCLINLGELCEASGKMRQALQFYEEALGLTRAIGSRFLESTVLNDLGNLCLKEGHIAEAHNFLDDSLRIAEEIKSRELIYKNHCAISNACETEGSLAPALYHFKKYHQVKEEVFNEEAERKTRALMIEFEVDSARKEKEIYRLKNIELAEAYRGLERLTGSLQKANNEKSELLADLRTKAKELENLALEDSLTGLSNRRFVDLELPHEFDRARRFGRTLTVVMADIDQFKAINDRFSHQIGDEVLRTVATLIRKSCRSIDGVSRYGGEEFLLYFPETKAIKARIVCEKIRNAIAEFDWNSISAGLEVTISMGISDDLRVASYEKLIAAADMKLYEAKTSGRNRIH